MWKKRTITKLQQAPHCESLRSLAPFRNFDNDTFSGLAREPERLQAPADYLLFEQMSNSDHACSLVGEISPRMSLRVMDEARDKVRAKQRVLH